MSDLAERFTFFWDGPFSQWEPAVFILDGVEYGCAEQYMMAEKARLFDDEDTLAWIMEAEDPATHKALGRVVDGFERDVWEEEEDNGMPRCWNIVWRGNMAKFSQNEHLLHALLQTEGTSLVEASAEDTLWGIGLAADDPAAQDRASWRGHNWLGEVLDDVREQLAAGHRLLG
ncbi:MAG: NADAR family protein [Myxococcales bacterium]|nr:NADAR family protein [Myxococcales bacterium]